MTTELSNWMTVPQFSPTSIPTLPSLSLSESERSLIATLQSRAQHDRAAMELANAFYMGEQIIRNLNIAVPDDLWGKLRTVVGWPRIAVDPYVRRLSVEGFRLPGDTDVNQDVGAVWDANGLDAEQTLAFTDAFSMGRSYWLVGANPDGGLPLVTVESPLNMAVLWDVTGRHCKAALQSYMVDDQKHAALMLPDQTLTIAEDENKVWQLVNRDVHDFGRVPLHRMANNPRSNNRDGFSNITPELQTHVINASRTMMAQVVAGEIYSTPRMLLFGAQASDFQGPDGQARKAWDTYISLVTALERDEDGNLPEIKQMTVYDPSVFTKIVEMYASQVAGILDAVPQNLGLYTQGNPTSSEAWESMDKERSHRSIMAQKTFGVPIIGAQQDAQRFMNKGRLPAEFERMKAAWKPVLPSKTADDISKLVAAKSVPPRSDVTLDHAGFSAVERQQMEQDWRDEDQRTALAAAREQITARANVAPAPVTPDANPVA